LSTNIINDRETGLKIGFDSTDWPYKITFDDYKKACENWIIGTIQRDGHPIGAVYKKEDELHISIKPEWRKKWLTKGLVKELFWNKRVTTRVTPGHDFMFPILDRLGFKDDGTGLMIKEN
jgi:hypothetical protein